MFLLVILAICCLCEYRFLQPFVTLMLVLMSVLKEMKKTVAPPLEKMVLVLSLNSYALNVNLLYLCVLTAMFYSDNLINLCEDIKVKGKNTLVKNKMTGINDVNVPMYH